MNEPLDIVQKILRVRKHLLDKGCNGSNEVRTRYDRVSKYIRFYKKKLTPERTRKYIQANYTDITSLIPANQAGNTLRTQLDACLNTPAI